MACLAALTMSWWFWRAKAPIGKAVAIDKLAEAINMAVILTFAVAYYLDLFVKMSVFVAGSLRLAAIFATLISSMHLGWQTHKIIEKD